MVSSGKIKLLLAVLVTTAIVGIVAVITMKGSQRAPMASVQVQLPQNIDLALHNARFSEMRNGSKVWELVAKRAEYDKSGEMVFLSDIRMDFVKSASNDAITVTAAQGDYSSKSNNITLRGAVHVTTGAGASFETESINYLAAKAQLRTADMVNFRHQRLTMTAQGMELNVKDQKARFYKAINAAVSGFKSE
ncbi:MAG TPA: LPS export ABC transporter periplasmic protein LptC [Desulfuromonadaceae bacterium]|jgi:LPS export ABC transporter protein LptC